MDSPSSTFENIQKLAKSGDVRISEHGYDELANDDLTAREIVTGLKTAILLEDYPDFNKGPSILTLQADNKGLPIHAVWGIPIEHTRPAVLITAYRPDFKRWNSTFTERKT